MARVFRAKMPPGPKFVLVCLADHANDQGMHVYPSQRLQAQKTGFSERTVRDHLHWLEQQQLLLQVRAPGGAERGTREYRIDVAAIEALPRAAEAAARQDLPPGRICRPQPADLAGKPSREPSRASEPSAPTPLVGSPRQRDLLWDLFDELCGPVTNNAERGRRNRGVASIRQSLGRTSMRDITEGDVAVVRAACARARAEWQGKPVDAHSVAVNWRALTAPAQSQGTLSLDDMARQAGA